MTDLEIKLTEDVKKLTAAVHQAVGALERNATSEGLTTLQSLGIPGHPLFFRCAWCDDELAGVEHTYLEASPIPSIFRGLLGMGEASR